MIIRRLSAIFVLFAASIPLWGRQIYAQALDSLLSGQFPGDHWNQTSPASDRWNPKKLAAAISYAQNAGATSLMLIHHGLVVTQFGDITERTELHSCRKSLLSALIGIAVADKKIRLDETLESLHVDEVFPSLTPAEKQATVRDLLEARSGIYHASAYETNGMARMRPARGSHPPGTFWYYNNWDFNTLGSIYEQATGISIFDALEQEIALPIGMEDYRPKDGRYVKDPVSRFPAYPIRMSTRDLARFALLYLHQGSWKGKQIIPTSWIHESLEPRSNTESGGYGYLWWTADPATRGFVPKYRFPPGSFWLEGHLGQYAVIIPSNDLVVVFRVKGNQPTREIHKNEAANLVQMIIDATEQ